MGSTTNLAVRGASAAAFIEGELEYVRDPYSVDASLTASTVETVILAIRCRGEFGGTISNREAVPARVFGAVETVARVGYFRLVLNPTLVGTTNWARVNVTTSSVDFIAPTGVTRTGGVLLETLMTGGSSSSDIDLTDLNIRLEPGDILAICAQTAAATSVVVTGLTWHET